MGVAMGVGVAEFLVTVEVANRRHARAGARGSCIHTVETRQAAMHVTTGDEDDGTWWGTR